jgi:hypothetical protein
VKAALFSGQTTRSGSSAPIAARVICAFVSRASSADMYDGSRDGGRFGCTTAIDIGSCGSRHSASRHSPYATVAPQSAATMASIATARRRSGTRPTGRSTSATASAERTQRNESPYAPVVSASWITAVRR